MRGDHSGLRRHWACGFISVELCAGAVSQFENAAAVAPLLDVDKNRKLISFHTDSSRERKIVPGSRGRFHCVID